VQLSASDWGIESFEANFSNRDEKKRSSTPGLAYFPKNK
jgi:hypothetical protein